MTNETLQGYRVSPQQERLWRLISSHSAGAFRSACAVLVEGPLDIARLRRALGLLVSRHEILRTHFRLLPAMTIPVQVIAEAGEWLVREEDWGGLSVEEQEAGLEELLAGGDGSHDGLEEVVAARLGEGRHALVLGMSAMYADAEGLANLVRELGAAYEEAGAAGGAHGAEPSGDILQYADLAEVLNELLESEDTQAGRDYWREKVFPEPHTVKLSFENPTPGSQDFETRTHNLTIPPDLTARVEEVARRYRTTTAAVLLACWQTLLWRLSGQPDIVVGTVYHCRTFEGLDRSLGLFAKHLPIHAHLESGVAFEAVLRRVDGELCEAGRWQEFFTGEHLSAISPNAEGGGFFPYAFEYASAAPPVAAPPVAFTLWKRRAVYDRFGLKLTCRRRADALGVELAYDAARYAEADAARLGARFARLLASAVSDPSAPASRLDLLTAGERRQILEDWNATPAPYALDACLHELFEQQAARTPAAVAVTYEDRHLTYEELNRRAARLAGRLRSLGVSADAPVAVMAERSAELVVALLGVLKAGAAYLPLDAEYPAERLGFMLEDSGARVLLTQRRLLDANAQLASLIGRVGHVLDLDAELADYSSVGGDVPHRDVRPEHLAYVIYTSGSTGRPKGVMVSHRSITNRLLWMMNSYPLSSADRLLQKTPVSFDASVWELFVPLISGARLVLARPGGHRDSAYLVEAVREFGVTVLQVVPSMLGALVEEAGLGGCGTLREVWCGGEALSREAVRRLRGRLPAAEVHNLYGPTEAAIDATHHECTPEDEADEAGARVVPLGRPISNVRVLVLEAGGGLAPAGVAGELHIGGVGLARGYLNRPGLTAERFVPDPYSTRPGERLYRTGDLARYLPDGEVEFLGRIDDQVKVRGFRIELGEIESVLSEHEGVREAVVVAHEEAGGEKRLAAYLTGRGVGALSGAALGEYLRGRLPEYMIPSAFVVLDELPRTPNGKLDRRALPAPGPGQPEAARAYEAPGSPVEQVLAGIWAGLLGVERVSIHDNFFELGGHSLLATRLVSRVRKCFDVDVPLHSIFESPTVAGLAKVVEREMNVTGGSQTSPIRPADRGGRLPLSFAQQRLWFLDRLQPGLPTYNLPAAVRLRGPLDVGALGRGLNEVVRRHESLRTTFAAADGLPYQVIAPTLRLSLPVTDLGDLPADEREQSARLLAGEEAARPFDLARGPLLRARLLRLSAEDHVALLTMHHIVSDGWSQGVLVNELSALYAAFSAGEASPLAELHIQYADYAAWQREYLSGAVLEEQLAYWRGQLAGVPTLELPTDRPRPAVQTFRGARHGFLLGAELSAGLRAWSRAEGATLFMTLLAAFKVLLARYTGQHDVVVGTPVAGRDRLETEGLIGFFVNTLVLRAAVGGRGVTLREAVRRVRAAALGAYAHQGVPFERLVEELEPERDLSRQPLFQVMAVMQNAPVGRLEMGGVELEGFGGEGEEGSAAKFDLTLMAEEVAGGRIAVEVEYNRDLFETWRVERLGRHYERVLEEVVRDAGQEVARVELLTEPERRQLLGEWNAAAAPYALDRCLHQLFEQQAARTPAAVAVTYEDRHLTYGELNSRADRLARRLRSLGASADAPVAVMAERSAELVVALLGVLKAGAAYLPLDAEYPPERLGFMLEDSGARLLLAHDHLLAADHELAALAGRVGHVLDLDAELADYSSVGDDIPPATVRPDDLAYVIYTSGSTGRPKGVMIPHRAIANRLLWMKHAHPLSPADRLLQKTPVSFDASVWELFAPLLSGAQLVLARPGAHRDSAYLVAAVRRHEITVLQVVPSMLAALVEEEGLGGCRSLRQMWCGGEALGRGAVARLRLLLPAVQVHNLYGPTEAAIDATHHECGEADEAGAGLVALGRPLSNIQVLVLDAGGGLAPVGVAGELHIGGVGLARGYLNRAGLTAEKFVPNPFSREGGERLYRTGDLARYLPGGEVEFLGRIDDQVKIRGFRIEPGEVEAALCGHESVREAVVVAREEAEGGKRLVAYLVGAGEVSVEELRGYLKARLPEYMVPSAFVVLDELPRTPNGKLDRRALPAPEPGRSGLKEFVAPRTGVEMLLAKIWEDLLGVSPVGVTDNFFDLGGHSLLAVRMTARIQKQFGQEIPLAALFQGATIGHLATLLGKQSEGVVWSPLVSIRPTGRKRPFFCVHAIGGDVLSFYYLSRYLDEEQPFYALQAPPLYELGETYLTIEDYAARYVEAVRGAQPEGPYLLGGYSFGGVVAFEMAQQLRKQGQQVELLAVFDTSSPHVFNQLPEFDEVELLVGLAWAEGRAREKYVRLSADHMRQLESEERLQYFVEEMRKAELTPNAIEVTMLRRFLKGFAARQRATRVYHPHEVYEGRVSLFRCEEADAEMRVYLERAGLETDDPTYGWSAHTTEPVDVYVVPGHHNRMFLEPHVRGLAERVTACLEEAHRRDAPLTQA